MASKPISRGVQDGPPRSKFPSVRLNRGLGARGPSGLMLWGGVIAMSSYGFYLVRALFVLFLFLSLSTSVSLVSVRFVRQLLQLPPRPSIHTTLTLFPTPFFSISISISIRLHPIAKLHKRREAV